MELLNAIAKVRFSSARPQRVQLFKCPEYVCELLCLEPTQQLAASGACAYYLIAGSGQVNIGKETHPATLGSFVTCEAGESHTVVNSSEQRLICLVIS